MFFIFHFPNNQTLIVQKDNYHYTTESLYTFTKYSITFRKLTTQLFWQHYIITTQASRIFQKHPQYEYRKFVYVCQHNQALQNFLEHYFYIWQPRTTPTAGKTQQTLKLSLLSSGPSCGAQRVGNTIQWLNFAIQRIESRPLDSVIHPSNNRGQEVKNSCTIHKAHFITTVA